MVAKWKRGLAVYRQVATGMTLNNFQCFFYIKLIALITWLQYYKLKPLQPLFSRCENDCFITHAFLPNKHNQSCSKSLHQNVKWGDFDWTEILLVARKTYSNFSCQISRTVTNSDMHKSNSGFCTSLNTLGEINFQSKLCLKTKHQLGT